MSNCVFNKIALHLARNRHVVGQLILRKIIKIVATRCQILGLYKIHQNRFQNRFLEELTAPPPDPLAEIKGTYF